MARKMMMGCTVELLEIIMDLEQALRDVTADRDRLEEELIAARGETITD